MSKNQQQKQHGICINKHVDQWNRLEDLDTLLWTKKPNIHTGE